MTTVEVAEGVGVDMEVAEVDTAVAGQSLVVVEAVAEEALLADQGIGLALAVAITALLASMTGTLHAHMLYAQLHHVAACHGCS